VFIFCTENHVVRYKDRPSNWWHDEQFISIPTGRTMGVPIAKGVFKPGVKGSYTTIGESPATSVDHSRVPVIRDSYSADLHI
jgi:hypothetical protein